MPKAAPIRTAGRRDNFSGRGRQFASVAARMNHLPRRPVLPLDDRAVLGDDVTNMFVFEGVVGRGTYGTVYKVLSKATRQVRAVKENNIGKAGDGFTRDAIREISLLKELNHPNIMSPSSAVISLSKMYLDFEYAEYDLSAVVRHFHRSGTVPLPVVKYVMRQVLQGIHHMHSKLIMHRDLKPDNILIVSSQSPPLVKIADFGMARVFAEAPAPLYYDGTVCTIWYRAPELFLGAMDYTSAVDMWSAGCIFAELLAAEAVFKGDEEKEDGLYLNQLYAIISRVGLPNSHASSTLRAFSKWDKFWAACSHMRPASPLHEWLQSRGCSADAHATHLLQRMLDWDPSSRISAREALQLPFFDQGGDARDGGKM
jgi:cyclin-dependent kinase 8/11